MMFVGARVACVWLLCVGFAVRMVLVLRCGSVMLAGCGRFVLFVFDY